MFDSCNCFLYCYFYLKKKETVNYDTEKIYKKKKLLWLSYFTNVKYLVQIHMSSFLHN